MTKPSSKIIGQLGAYSALASAVLSIPQSADGNIIYTDIDPDVHLTTHGSSYTINLNNDTLNDFTLQLNKIGNMSFPYNQIKITPLYSNQMAMTYSAGISNDVVAPIAYSSAIGSGLSFNGTNSEFLAVYFKAASISAGPIGQTTYIGLKLDIPNGDIHYGWLRLSIDPVCAGFTLMDYAYEVDSAVSIQAGFYPKNADTASALVASDVANNGNGDDLQLAFHKGANENTISEYHAMAVINTKVAWWTIDSANHAYSVGNTIAIPKTGNNQTVTLGAGAVDTDGNPIHNGQPYAIFLLSIPDGTLSNQNAMSAPSNFITLTGPSSPASGLMVADIGDDGNGNDLQITFSGAADETKVDHYRVIAVRQQQVPNFDLPTAAGVPESNTVVVDADNAGTYTLALGDTATDRNGIAIKHDRWYTLFVFSVPDGVNATTGVLSGPSDSIRLETPAGAVSNVMAVDSADNRNGMDMEVSFDMAADEDKVKEYRIMVVKKDSAPAFDLDQAAMVAGGKYTKVTKTGSNIVTRLAADAMDVDGDSVKNDVPYHVFVMTVGDSLATTMDALSNPSNEVTLTTTIDTSGPDGLSTVLLENDLQIWSNGHGIQVRGRNNSLHGKTLVIHNLAGQQLHLEQLQANTAFVELPEIKEQLLLVTMKEENAILVTRKVFHKQP